MKRIFLAMLAAALFVTPAFCIDPEEQNDSAMIHFRVYRQGDTDANSDAIFIHEVDIHYKRDRLGSTKEYGDK